MPIPLNAPVTLTGIGSVPGTAVGDWPARISDQLPELPHVPELPQRGPGADMIGRTLGLLSQMAPDFTASTTVTGWELTPAQRDMRRARSLLGEDLDAVEASWAGHRGLAKQQLAGPYTLAANVERKGRRLLADPGLVRELVEAWRLMADQHRSDLQRRVTAQWLLQMDEPSLPAVIAGTVKTVSGFSVYPALPVDLELWADLVHCCAPGVPLSRVRGIAGWLFDLSQHTSGDDEALAELSTVGTSLGFGVSPGPGSVRGVLDFFDRTGLAPDRILITPPCGMVADYRPWRPVVETLTDRLS
ncbi:MAG: hypothetical protein MUD05_08185 [Candidatus Nanopelagicales bacterium]|nr:hypothetical protein [Candidatus Nanopelagicales bacterium]